METYRIRLCVCVWCLGKVYLHLCCTLSDGFTRSVDLFSDEKPPKRLKGMMIIETKSVSMLSDSKSFM